MSDIIFWTIVILLIFPSTRRIVTAPLAAILAVLGIIAFTSRDSTDNSRGWW